MAKQNRKVRYGVVGLGWFAQAAVLPAFANAGDNSELAALFTDDAEKARELSEKYGVPAHPNGDYDRVLASGDIQAVFIVVPNSAHREYTERAARAGVHVLCEKPMADTVEDCRAMIDACDRGGVKLMIAYRLHFEEANLNTVEVAQSGTIGRPRVFNSIFTQQVEADNVRNDADQGGGPLLDIGIYCINAARYLFRAEPVEVSAFAANGDPARFREVPEMVAALMRFPDERLATFTCGFGGSKVSTYQLVGTRGDVRLDPAYTFHGDISQVVTTDGSTQERVFKKRDQIAAEILYFSDCVLRGLDPEPDGEEGLIDVAIIQGMRRSFREGRPVSVGPFTRRARPVPTQAIHRPPVKEPELVKAEPPGGSD